MIYLFFKEYIIIAATRPKFIGTTVFVGAKTYLLQYVGYLRHFFKSKYCNPGISILAILLFKKNWFAIINNPSTGKLGVCVTVLK